MFPILLPVFQRRHVYYLLEFPAERLRREKARASCYICGRVICLRQKFARLRNPMPVDVRIDGHTKLHIEGACQGSKWRPAGSGDFI